MDCIARVRCGLLAAIFAVWSVLAPLNAAAATYSAVQNLRGATWIVPWTGSVLAGNPYGIAVASALGKANPWMTALTVGTVIAKVYLELANSQQVALRTQNGPLVLPPGWTENPADLSAPIPPATAASSGGTTQAATVGVGPALWTVQKLNGSTGAIVGSFGPDSASVVGQQGCSYRAGTLAPPQTGTYTGWNATYYRADCTFSSWGAGNTGGGMTQSCSGAGSTVNGTMGSMTCSQAKSCPVGFTLSGSTCTSGVTCPAGYSLVGAACNLTDASLVKRPDTGQSTLKVVGNTIVPDPSQSASDAALGAPTQADLQNAGNGITKDTYGNPTMTNISPSSGGYQLNQQVQTTQNNQTYTTQNTITVNNAGTVTEAYSHTYAGSIKDVGTTNPAAVQFPDDYNRELTQNKILTGEGAVDDPGMSADAESRRVAMQAQIESKIGEVPGQFGTDKSQWFSWVWTPPLSSCVPWESVIHGQPVVWNLCPYINALRDAMGWLFAIGGAWVTYNQMFRRDES